MRSDKATNKQAPIISIYTTVYNSVHTVEKSVKSLAKVLNDLSYEIVVVDNYSTDGTYETLIKLSEKYPIRVYRAKASRGLGRRLAVKLAKGKYLVYVDLDCFYTETLRRLIQMHLNSVFRDLKCLDVLICPKEILNANNFQDLNRSEDVELVARLFKKDLIYTVPPLKSLSKPLRYELRETHHKSEKLLPTYVSEHRYTKNLVGYLKRELFNKIHYIIGSGFTPTKFIREEYFIWRKWRNYGLLSPFLILFRTSIALLIYYLVKLIGKKIYSHDKHLTNHLLKDYAIVKHIALPRELNLTCDEIVLTPLRNTLKYLQYLFRFYEVADFTKLWTLYGMCGSINNAKFRSIK